MGKLKINIDYDYQHNLDLQITVEDDVVERIVGEIMTSLAEAMTPSKPNTKEGTK